MDILFEAPTMKLQRPLPPPISFDGRNFVISASPHRRGEESTTYKSDESLEVHLEEVDQVSDGMVVPVQQIHVFLLAPCVVGSRTASKLTLLQRVARSQLRDFPCLLPTRSGRPFEAT